MSKTVIAGPGTPAGIVVGVHLACYDIAPKTAFPTTVQTFNQFGTQILSVDKADMLCVPSQKFLVDTALDDAG